MLLSDTQTAQFLDQNFVLAWNEVRPVPKVTIDFGDGRTLQRTLKGNTAFYVCRPDGKVVDILPGVYQPEAFRAELEESLRLVGRQESEVVQNHRLLGLGPEPAGAVTTSKAVVEAPLLRALDAPTLRHPNSGEKLAKIDDLSSHPASRAELDSKLPGSGNLGERALEGDSKASLEVLRPAVHQMFAEFGKLPTIEDCRHQVFTQILKVDIDDPYLGLKIEDIPGTD